MAAARVTSSRQSKRNKSSKDAEQHVAVHDKPTKLLEPTSTRVCIKNIPPSFSSVQLRDFLIKEYRTRQQQRNNNNDMVDNQHNNNTLVVTDCRVLFHKDKKTSRRIAFAGFQTTQMAQNVIEWFDKSFARTSRLVVEPAFGNAGKDDKPANTKVEASKDVHPNQKSQEKQRDEAQKITEELLAVGDKKSRFWANDFEIATDRGTTKHVVEELQRRSGTQEEELDDEKQKDNVENDDDDDSTASSSSSEEDDADPLTHSQARVRVSDMEFLKSKQRMVENLELEEQVAETDDLRENSDHDVETKKSSSDSSVNSDNDNKESQGGRDGGSANSSTALTSAVWDKRSETTNKELLDRRLEVHGRSDNERDSEEEQGSSGKAVASSRLFVRNLPFTTTEDDLEGYFGAFGSVIECHIPVDDRKMSKGFAFVSFDDSFDAERARTELNGRDFQGRFLHILSSKQKPKSAESAENNMGANDRPLSYKERQELARKRGATKDSQGWLASFVRGDAVVDSLADRLGIKKGDILNVKDGLKSGDAAVRLALGETQVIEENREYFKNHGIDMEALVSAKSTSSRNNDGDQSAKRSSKSILVKNLPYDTLLEDLQKVFHNVGDAPTRILLPPSRTIALVEYKHSSDAKRVFRKLAYRRFKNVPLYLEWAPVDASARLSGIENEEIQVALPSKSTEIIPDIEDEPALDEPAPSIYIKNLNFSTTEEQLKKIFEKHVSDVRAVRIPKKLAPLKKPHVGGSKKEEELRPLSMGFGFVEFASQASAKRVLKELQGTLVDGHALELKPSSKSLTAIGVKPPDSSKKATKLVVRNVPFQATRTELLKLFGSFGQLKRVRVPKKFDGGHRGFAFIEFVTHKEASDAMKALSRTHLYGRHLVLEWAEDDSEENTNAMAALREKAKRDVLHSSQSSKRKKLS